MADEHGAPGLDDLRRELQAVGMVVVPFGDEIHVRRSTLEYIKVRVDGGVLHCEPWVGVMSQAKTTWAVLAAEMIIIPALLFQPAVQAHGLVVAFGGLLAFGLNALRYTLAEVAIGRVQSVWLNLQARHRALLASLPVALPAPATPALPEGNAPVREESKAHYMRTPR